MFRFMKEAIASLTSSWIRPCPTRVLSNIAFPLKNPEKVETHRISPGISLFFKSNKGQALALKVVYIFKVFWGQS